MPSIEILIGMIASGKSTYARERAGEGALVISHDDLTQMLHAEYRYEQELRDCYRQMEDCLAERANTWGRDVVVDRTHLTREGRRRWIDFGSLLSIPVVAVAFPMRDARYHALARFRDDARGRSLEDWTRVAEHHHEQATAEPLGEDEGFAQVRYIDRDGPAPSHDGRSGDDDTRETLRQAVRETRHVAARERDGERIDDDILEGRG